MVGDSRLPLPGPLALLFELTSFYHPIISCHMGEQQTPAELMGGIRGSPASLTLLGS